MAKLILRKTDGTETEHALDEHGSCSIGRSPECDLPIDDHQASRRHCSVVRVGGGYEMSDLGSTNGTLVNSTLQKKMVLSHGDVIRIGATEIVFHDMEAASGDSAEEQTGLLVYAKGDKKGEKVHLAQQRTTFGRKDSNTVVLQDANTSSYHCEIVRDLNGYTIRDLGSTNGTLVNGEMITEAQIAHGAKVRVGQTLFVFQDPAMADIDLDLAGVEDDDQEWGMMRELDLAAVRKRNPATIVYTILFFAIVGGGYYMTQLEEGKKNNPTGPPKGTVLWSTFDSPADAFAWDTDPPGKARSSVGDGKLNLKASKESGADVFYANALLDVENASFEIKASTNGPGAVGLLWEGAGLRRWTTTSSGSGTFSAPVWARSARAGMRLQGTETLRADDFYVIRSSRGKRKKVEDNNFELWVTDGRWADLTHVGAPKLVNGRILARDASGGGLDTAGMTVACAAGEESHLDLTLQGAPEGAAWIGIEFEEVGGYLGQGFRAFGTDAEGERFLVSSFPDQGGSIVRDDVRKLLLGSAGRAFSVLGATDNATLAIDATWLGRTRSVAILGRPKDGKLVLRFKTNLRGEQALASDQIDLATTYFRQRKLGDFIHLAAETLAEFPFAGKGPRERLRNMIRQTTQEFEGLSRKANNGLAEYKEFRDLESLDQVRAAVDIMRKDFQVAGSEGPWGKRYVALFEAERKERYA
ncbi:MAG: FHA domain-containing protein, partial [Planctomycetota bacterium]|nr:FHA domain-containing protein [Planctomycetota bacterium]